MPTTITLKNVPPRRALVAYLHGMNPNEFDALTAKKASGDAGGERRTR
jgi:hypothetical protein